MKLIIFISPPLFEPSKGKTYHTCLMPSRQVFDGAFFGCNATKREAGEEMHLSRLLIVSSGPFSPARNVIYVNDLFYEKHLSHFCDLF
jgi:hypothetical protein